MVNSCVKCCFGVGYGGFYIFISIWGVLFLGLLGILLKTGHEGNIGIEYKKDDDKKKVNDEYGNIMLITVGIYLAFIIGCSINIWYRSKHPWPVEEEKDAHAQFSAIGPKNFEKEDADPTQLIHSSN